MKRLIPVISAVVLLVFSAGSAQAAFGLTEFKVWYQNADGTTVEQAGSHPYAMDTLIKFDTTPPAQEVRNLEISLPVGFVGNATAEPTCTSVQFKTPEEDEDEVFGTSCPEASVVGAAAASVLGGSPDAGSAAPAYNLEPSPGAVAAIGFRVASVPVVVEFHVNPARPSNLFATVTGLMQSDLTASFLEVWGEPSDSSHDPYRGHCLQQNGLYPFGQFVSKGDCPTSATRPFLTAPRTCQESGTAAYRALSWAGTVTTGSTEILKMRGCDRLGLAPQITASPSSGAAASASGLDFDLADENPGLISSGAIAGSDIKEVATTLPEGFVADPSLAEGLAGCTEADLARETATSPVGAGCPEASKIGTVEVETPLLAQTLSGTIYAAQPYHNQAGNSLLGTYVVIKDPELGILIQQPLQIDPDPVTGRLVATAKELPQLPFSHFKLRFRGGERAPLTTPSTCGTYKVSAVLTPWSGTGSVTTDSTFEIVTGPAGGACPGGAPAFAPGFEAGTVSPLAASYSPFVLKLTRAAGSPQFRSIDATLPSGLLAKLSGVAQCSDAQIAAAQARSLPNEGALESASPSCPAASEIGSVVVGAGSGAPTVVRGRAYLAGPYKGAPLSMVVVTPAVTGPFDLGTVVVRTALYVNEATAQVQAVSDPLPSILQGIPLDLRSISIDLARPEFTLDPTSCEPSSVGGQATSLLGQVASLSSRFQVGGCKGLRFKPSLKLFLSGQTKRTGNPALKAVLTQPKGENANIARTAVILPKGMFIDQSHINNPCTRVQFNSGAVPGESCPAKSVLGTAKVWTPLLEKPEEGKVYFRSNGGERKLPDLVVALRGQIPVQLVGFVDSVKAGKEATRVRTRFQSIPDAPVSRFELKLAGGKKGLLENSRNLCRSTNRATFKLGGQNGKAYDTEPDVGVSCGKAGKGPGEKKG